jgi:2'-5' RNA ligase
MNAPNEPGESAQAPREKLRRVFFALWPDAATRASLVRATRRVVRRSGGRPIQADDLHITVAFLGGVTAPALELARGVPPIEVGAFGLTLDALGFKRRSRILWLACRHISPALTRLEQLLWQRLAQLGFEREARIYRPHVTLARAAQAVDEEVAPVEWPAADLALVESLPVERGVRYTVLERWPL